MVKKIPILIIIFSFFLAFCFYPYLPDILASHWDINGQVNGYVGKSFGLFFMPILSIAMYFLFLFLPKTDPYKKNFKLFEKYFDQFIIVIFFFQLYTYCLTLVWNLGIVFNMNQFISPPFALICYFAGVLLSKAKRNWFVGIRTPWTLSSALVWQKTHSLGAVLFKISSLICLLALIWPSIAFYFILTPLLGSSLFLFVYSYVIYRRLKQ